MGPSWYFLRGGLGYGLSLSDDPIFLGHAACLESVVVFSVLFFCSLLGLPFFFSSNLRGIVFELMAFNRWI